MQNTKQTILSASLIAVFILFVFYEKQSADSVGGTAIVEPSVTTVDKFTSSPLATQSGVPVQEPLPAPVPPTTPTQATQNPTPGTAPFVARYKDGVYTGKVADAYYGNIQVATVINEGKITDLKFLQYPKDQKESLEISNRTMPKLKSEAVSSQNVKVDIISGATQTCEAFNETYRDALLQAKA